MHTTVYIQKKNEDKWSAIANKSAWLNEQLDGGSLEERVSALESSVRVLAPKPTEDWGA